jgi:hypothetical protein
LSFPSTNEDVVYDPKSGNFICGAIQKFLKYINKKTITSYLDLILHYHLQSSPFGSAHTNPSVSATLEMHPGSLSLLGCLVLSVFPLEFPQLYQIFAPSTWFHLEEEKKVAWS